MTQPASAKPRLNSAFKQLMSIHWWMAGCYLILFIGGWFMTQLPRDIPIRSPLYDFHKSIGVLTMALLTWRIFTLLQVWWRKYTRRLPKFSPSWARMVALHISLYSLMWTVPVTGFFLSNSFRSQNVKFFGIPLPDIFPVNREAVDFARNTHFWLAYTFLALVLLHMLDQRKVTRALWRRFIGFIKTHFSSLTQS